MQQKAGLANIVVKDADNAKSMFTNDVLEAGTYAAKIIGFTEEETYNFITVEINGQRYNFFYNWFLRDSEDLNADVLNWIKSLSTIPVTPETTMMEIANSSIGSTYTITVYNYVSKSGKTKGKTQHAISFTDLPIIDTTVVQSKEVDVANVGDDDLPF